MASPHSSAPPLACVLIELRLHNSPPSLHPFVGDFSANTGCSVPELRFRTFALMVLPFVAFRFASQSQVPTFRSTASCASSGHLCIVCRLVLVKHLSEIFREERSRLV